MPRYAYQAKSTPKKIVRGFIEAESEAEALTALGKMGYFPLSLAPEEYSRPQGAIFFYKNPKKEICSFTRELSTLLNSGVNILSSLTIITKQTRDKHFKSVLSDLAGKIKDGSSLSESMRSYPRFFSELYASVVHSGEASGNIDLVLSRLADFLEKERDFEDTVKLALIYPAFVLVVGAITVAVLLGFVIPKLTVMFQDMGQLLPLPTRILIAVSRAFSHWWWLILLGACLAVFLWRRSSRLPQVRIFIDGVKIKTVLLGSTILKTEISRLARTLSLLLSGGLPIVTALEIASSSLQNRVIKTEVQKFKEKINSGASLSACLKESGLFPEMVESIVRVGEEAGSLDKSLNRISEDYEKEVDRQLKALTRLLEPMVILVMGLIVGFIVLSLLLPIFELNFIVR
jgi:type II secretory pathway component PulF